MPAVFNYESLCEWRHRCSQRITLAPLQLLHFLFPRRSALNQRWIGNIRRVAAIVVAVLCAFPALGSSAAQAAGPAEIVRQAIINYKARALNAKQYTCIENDGLVFSHNGKSHQSDTYEVIPLGETVYRRHRLHDGLPLPPQEEKSEQQKLEQQKQEAQKTLQRTMNDSGPNSEIVRAWVQVVDRPYQFWEFNLENLPSAFDFTLLRQETLDGRNVYVIEGKPREAPKWGLRERHADVRNFDIKLWIDAAELEIITVEASARNRGVWAQPVYAVVNQRAPGIAKDELDSVYETSEFYERGTLITMQWRKVNDGPWLLESVHAKGKVSWKEPNWINAAWAAMEQQTTYSNYQKFRVTHRILPDALTKEPLPPRD